MMAEGAIQAGCKFFAGYPITPATGIFKTMVDELPAHGGLALSAPDEISAIAYCIGASMRGYKAMTATSGPGWALMIESVQYALMTESPLVVSLVQRLGPSTGGATQGAQGDVLRGTKDWYALAIANSWLGEHRNSSSHLYQVIREKRGLNYGDYSYIEHYPNGGQLMLPPQNVARRQQIFEIWIRPVPNETRNFALRAALRENKMLVENGMSKSDFELTRNFLKKYVLNYAQTTMERLGYALDDMFYGIKGSHLETYRSMMDKLTLNDVSSAIKKYWQFGNLQIAVITKDAQSLKDALVNDATSPITYGSPKPDQVLQEDKKIIAFPVKVKPENIKIVSVSDLFLK